MTGEKIYSYDLDSTGMTDYGIALPSIVSGQSKVPPQGARIDVAFAGLATGRPDRVGERRRLPNDSCRRPHRP